MVKVLVTGTHFTVAQAVMDELRDNFGANIVYVGRKYTLEGDRTVSREFQELSEGNVRYYTLTTGRLQRSWGVYTIPSLLKIPWGMVQALYYVAVERPDVVLSFGGYVSLPVVVAAWVLSIPIIVHEQTLVSGLANRISGFLADRVAVSFKDGNYEYDPSKIVYSGNPIRRELKSGACVSAKLGEFLKLVKKKGRLILFTGGNQGSHVLNTTVFKCLEGIAKKCLVVVQTGDSKYRDFEKIVGLVEEKNLVKRVYVSRWLGASDMGEVLRSADLVVSRAGINTLSELAFFEVPAVVVPIPYLYKDEQMENAMYFKELGLVKVLAQAQLSQSRLEQEVDSSLHGIGKWKRAIKGIREKVVLSGAASRVALETMLLAQGV